MRKKRNNKKKARNDTSGKARKTYKKKNKQGIIRVPKTRNNGEWTESMFWQMIRAALRNKSRWWKPRLAALAKARRPSQSKNKRLKWEFQCCKCTEWFPQTQVQVHHAIEAGKLNSSADLAGFVERLFAETGWECVCKACHSEIHNKNK